MPAHSTVNYVEPNVQMGLLDSSDEWRVLDEYERAPRLEDYCIALNLEVEVSSRDILGQKDVLILQWSNDKKDMVSFMGGTKMGGYKISDTTRTARLGEHQPQNLTTYYADMYVGDLIDYGTTEMIGIKSVNISYQKSCVPVIQIKFTDVRGLSLFQPTELSRSNLYDGIKGLSKDNVAQSFFQCFFKLPLPKFTIYIKGFYGKPVAYEMVCDGFQTNFNSETGDYDVDTKFIGYAYSFLTDISFDAVLAAPYSDFEGKKYWEENLQDRFFIYDKNGKKMTMPTLYEMHSHLNKLLKESESESLSTTLTEEEKTHSEEIKKLESIQQKYQLWYSSIFEMLKQKYGKRYVFDFKDSINGNDEWYRILVLTNEHNSDENLSNVYEQSSEILKNQNNDLYSTIEEFNKSGISYKNLENISKDFSKYTKVKVFKDCYVNRNDRKIEFGGFHRDFEGNKTEIVNRLFYNQVSKKDSESATTEVLIQKRKEYTDFTLSTIYGDGVNQYTSAFIIDVDYSDIRRRIAYLTADKSKSVEEKEEAKRRKEHNRLMINKMNWYPSVENFTKILMAHVETYIMMLFKVQDMCKERTASGMGVTVGSDGIASDVPKDSQYLPPFPRITREETGDDGLTKKTEVWVGEFNDANRFVETDMVNGLFNGMAVIDALEDERKKEEASDNQNNEDDVNLIFRHPLTSFDFFLTKSPYGTDTDIANNPNAFAGKVMMRMFMILSINNFKKGFKDIWSFGNSDFLNALGRLEAENFYDTVKITNKTMLEMLGVGGGEGTITPKAILDCVLNGNGIGGYEEIPWKNGKNEKNLFSNTMWLTRYETQTFKTTEEYKTRLYPIQDMSYSNLDKELTIFSRWSSSVDKNNNDIFVSKIDVGSLVEQLLKSENESCFGAVYISDDYKKVLNMVNKSSSYSNEDYDKIYQSLNEELTFNKEEYKEFVNSTGVFKPKLGITTNKASISSISIEANTQDLPIYFNENTKVVNQNESHSENYAFDSSKLDTFVDEVENGSITSWFFTECRGFYKDTKGGEDKNALYKQDINSSFFVEDYQAEIDKCKENWIYGDDLEKKMAFFLMSLDAIDYNAVSKVIDSNRTFTYLPRLAVLQIGAALCSLNNIQLIVNSGDEKILQKIVLTNSFNNIFCRNKSSYLNKMNDTTKIVFMRYFKNWVSSYSSSIIDNLFPTEKSGFKNTVATYKIGDTITRALFREDSDFSKGLADKLMMPVLITKASVNHFKNITSSGLTFVQSNAESYLEGFLTKLKELYSNPISSGGDGVKLAVEPKKITDDMKQALYTYLKLTYDKWIPSTTREEWMFETFFDEEKERNIRSNRNGGHLFHFIDSYYNKIGDKLLVNPLGISRYIEDLLSSKNVNDMVIGFMTKIYGDNKCMFIPLQNFQDLTNKDSMNMMFNPIPYSKMEKANKHPDFVVVYPYSPSKYLNSDNGEYNDDSFMLNNEFETPLAIRSRSDEKGWYRIPAFGVSYGKQYQSYFKKVNVDTKSPIATQQALIARDSILRGSRDGKAQGVVAQDIYDIYATQSYTCTVEMMGCAWVQPLMYFVLTNIPLFKGSYMIISVTHSITQGNMTTTFKGARMANVATKMVEEIFTDDFMDDSTPSSSPLISDRNRLADIDNDCPYKVYPLNSDDDATLSKDEIENANKAMSILMDEFGFTKAAAAGICGNIYKESTWRLHVTNGIGAFGLCQWLGARKKLLIEKYGQLPTLHQQMEYIDYEWSNESVAKSHRTQLNNAATPEDAAYIVRKFFERPGEAEADDATRKSHAKKYFDNYQKPSEKKEEIKPNGSDINDKFLRAVQKSLDSTNVSAKLNKNKASSSERLIIDGTNRLDLVFDIILNGYYEYVQRLSWVLKSNDSDYLGKPYYLEVIVKEKVDQENRRVYICRESERNNPPHFQIDSSSINKSFLKSIHKKYKGNKSNEIPQFDNMDLFKEIEVKDCNTLMNGGGVVVDNVQCGLKDGKIGDWNVSNTVSTMKSNLSKCGKQYGCGNCWAFVKDGLVAGGFKRPNTASAYQAKDFLIKNGFKCIFKGEHHGHSGTDYGTPCIGDITVFEPYYVGKDFHKHGHIHIFCGDGWYSDYKSENWCNRNANGDFSVWRYCGKGKQ